MCAQFAQSQTLNPFPNTDSLRRFINKWVRNSPIDAFTNLRLNSALIGMSRFLDSADAAGSAVTGVTALNDSTIRITTNDLDTFVAVIPGRHIGVQGISFRSDTAYLGGRIDSFTLLKTISQKAVTPGSSVPASALVISNVGYDSAGVSFLKTGNELKSLLYTYRYFFDNDTLPLYYGGAQSSITRHNFSTSKTRFKNPLTPFVPGYGGQYNIMQLFPPDTIEAHATPFGGSFGNASDIGIGQNSNYRMTISSDPGLPAPYPWAVWRTGIDLARASSSFKRETLGNGYTGYIWDYRNHQSTINAGTTEYGSYVGRITGFRAYGSLNAHTSSPSKAKTLAVSTSDTVVAVEIDPMWLPLNEVKNGYGIWQKGTSDNNLFAGFTRVGGTLPLYNEQIRRFNVVGTSEFSDSTYINTRLKIGNNTAFSTDIKLQVDDTVAATAIGATNFFTPETQVSINHLQTGVTQSQVSTRKKSALYVFQDKRYSPARINLGNQFNTAAAVVFNVVRGNDTVDLNLFAASDFTGMQVFNTFRKNSTWTDTTYFLSSQNPVLAVSGMQPALDMSSAPAVGRDNIYKGWYTALMPLLQGATRNKVEKAAWMITGAGQNFFPNGSIDTAYHIYMADHSSSIGVRYGLYQAGPSDSNYLAGQLRMPNVGQVSLDTTTYKPAVFGPNGVVYKSYWQNSGGGGGGSASLTTNYIGVGDGSGNLAGSSAFTYNSTTVKQENSGAAYSGVNTASPGSTSGYAFRAFLKATPDAADRLMGSYDFGTLDGGSTENVTASIRAFSTAAHTPGTSEQTNLRFYVSATNALSEFMRITANLRLGIGVTSPSAAVHVRAGNASSGGAPFMYTAGTNLTTPAAGAEEYDGTSRYFTPGSTRLRYALTDNSIPSNGQIPIGNGANFTNATLTQGKNVTITNGAGSITIAAGKFGINTYTSNTSASSGDIPKYVFLSGASGTVNYQINPASFTDETFAIKCIDATNTVKITLSSGTIDGLSELQLVLNQTVWVTSNGTNLYIVNQ